MDYLHDYFENKCATLCQHTAYIYRTSLIPFLINSEYLLIKFTFAVTDELTRTFSKTIRIDYQHFTFCAYVVDESVMSFRNCSPRGIYIFGSQMGAQWDGRTKSLSKLLTA